MLNFLKSKETLLTEKIAQQLVKDADKTHPIKAIKNVAVLTNDEVFQQIDLQRLVEKKLGVSNASVFVFKKFDKNNPQAENYFSEKDITKKGKLINSEFETFLNTEFDVLLTILDENHLFVEFATATSRANYKVGFSGVNSDLFHLEIASDTSKLDEFLAEVKRYLQILNKLS